MIRSATVQFKPIWGGLAQNRERISDVLESLVVHQPQVIVLPEMCVSGYVFADQNEIAPFCEPRDGETFAMIAAFCRAHGVYVAYGFAEKDGTRLFNAQNLVNPTGRLAATYRKMHLYEQDYTWALPGDTGFMTVETDIGRLGLGICMDMNFDDFAGFHIAARSDLICFSACWLDEGFSITPYWQYRMQGFEGAICIANSFGEERGIFFRGESAVFSGGSLIAVAPVDQSFHLMHSPGQSSIDS